jgi:hypothetical protein
MGTLTINTTSEQDTRIAAAVQNHLGLNDPATGPEVTAWVKSLIKAEVLAAERDKAITTAIGTVVDIEL